MVYKIRFGFKALVIGVLHRFLQYLIIKRSVERKVIGRERIMYILGQSQVYQVALIVLYMVENNLLPMANNELNQHLFYLRGLLQGCCRAQRFYRHGRLALHLPYLCFLLLALPLTNHAVHGADERLLIDFQIIHAIMDIGVTQYLIGNDRYGFYNGIDGFRPAKRVGFLIQQQLGLEPNKVGFVVLDILLEISRRTFA